MSTEWLAIAFLLAVAIYPAGMVLMYVVVSVVVLWEHACQHKDEQ
jgi:hypothetical protein